VTKENWKEKRLKSNIKIQGICDYMGMSRTTYFKLETGRRKTTKAERNKLNQLFERSI